MRVVVIINPVAGPAARRAHEPERRARLSADVLRALGAEADVVVTRSRGHAAELATSAVRAGVDGVVAWGGDGTVNEVASALAGSRVALTVVPTGSGNGFARALGVPRDSAEALSRAVRGTSRTIDVGTMDGREFVNVAGCGFDAHVARLFNAMRGTSRGLLTYVRITARELWRYRGAPLVVVADGERMLVDDPLLVACANSSQYGNGARIAPGAHLDDGRLDLVVARRRSVARTLIAARRLFDGTIASDAGVTLRTVTEVAIAGDGPIAYHVDGEPCQGGNELRVEIRPGALSVRV